MTTVRGQPSKLGFALTALRFPYIVLVGRRR